MRSIPLLAAAEEELAEAARRYEAEAAGLAEMFLGEFERALDRIMTFPSHGTPYLAGTRRVVLQRFRFQIVYTVEDDQILVVAVAHQRRRPGYWRNRVEPWPNNGLQRTSARQLLGNRLRRSARR